MRTCATKPGLHADPPAPIPFPVPARTAESMGGEEIAGECDVLATADEVLAAFATVSRRITDLARELKCLGYFDDAHDGRPRAA